MRQVQSNISLVLTLVLLSLAGSGFLHAQIDPVSARVDTIPPIPSMTERAQRWGRNDTLVVSAIWYQNEMMPYKELEMVWVGNGLSGKKMEKYIAEWTRLRNAVYVTYPYARIAGSTINDINKNLEGVTNKKSRRII
jgi:hypothetical protein